MKKMTRIIALVLVLVLALGVFAGCGGDGKYYLVMNGEKTKDYWLEIKDGEWEDSTGLSGPCEIDGKEITLKSEPMLGISATLMSGEISGGTITFDVFGEEIIYKK